MLAPLGIGERLAEMAPLVPAGLEIAVGKSGGIQRGFGAAHVAEPVHAEMMMKGLAAHGAESGLFVVKLVEALPAADEAAVLSVEARAVITDEAAERAAPRLRVKEMPVRRLFRGGGQGLGRFRGRSRRRLLLRRQRAAETEETEDRADERQQRRDDHKKADGLFPRGTGRTLRIQSSTSTSSPSSCGRKRGQTFSETVITEAASRVPISTASGMVLP